MRRVSSAGRELLVPALVLLVWGVWSARAGNFFFPPLTEILRSFRENWLFARVGSDVLPSMGRMTAGYLIAAVLGVGAGILIGQSPMLRRLTDPVVEFLRALPPPVLIPLAVVLLGIGPQMKVFVIAAGCVWPILLNTVDGVRGLDPVLGETARIYGISRWDRVRSIMLPAASPRIFAGLRSALALALILMVISEMQASTNGIGFFVLQSQRSFAIPEMWSGILLLGLLGYLINAGFQVLEARLLRWHRGARRSALAGAQAA